MAEGILNVKDENRSECLVHVKGECGNCSDEVMISKYGEFLKRFEQSTDGDLIRLTKKYLNVKRESQIWGHPLFRAWYGEDKAEAVLRNVFKPKGPAHDTSLLNNFNIDDTLEGWAKHGEQLFSKKIKHYSFHMIDFASDSRKELNQIDIGQLIKEGYSAGVCVINTDMSWGGGKHWFCIYLDLSHLGTSDDPMILEFFNSSGNQPMEPMIRWIKNVSDRAVNRVVVKYKKAMKKRIQYSRTECGVWCLSYLKARLQDKTSEWFEECITDDIVTNYRKHLFRD